MRKEVIGPSQLFAMIVLFELGTALVVPIGLKSGHAVWLSILMALPGGVLLYLIYYDLYRQFPELIMSGYTQKILGKAIGWPLSLLYIPVLMFNGSRNLREAGDLLISSTYDRTPILVINAIMVIAVMYILNKGIEVFARTAEIYFWIIMIMGLVCNFIVIAAGLVDVKHLFPLQADDWWDALSSAYPSIWIFPFGELVCMTTVLPHFNKPRKAKRAGVMAVILSGLLLTFTHAIEISVLGENIYSRAAFPIYTTITLVNVANFIQRLDALVILTLIIGVFFKMSIYCYAATVITADLFKVQDYRKLVVPVGVIVLFSSFMSAENYTSHLNEGRAFLKYILPLLCAVIPILLFLVHHVRKRFGWYR
ncbi:spore gernimation protein GerB [Paenibacillus helianthi]|uniref:Spore gernimation protein GerB n=1 Tax=Paenibacillus helianthi TaxID=1349432 RepID=A0ABX3EQF5_9BACL|nr:MULTISPECIES: GerAB/ArcD/ProY family transporter [Paenibacillus]OKP76014.1 spore gernimation protein GerB [Paenibacillus sp. P3E]OKP84367.1 spore gernimation protein GerB [Paenibacillus sp. P32E]OKP86686.1 spore gernimation protein GerB [Paenibacillus helianthi]